MMQIPASTPPEGTLVDGEKVLMQGDPSLRRDQSYVTLHLIQDGASFFGGRHVFRVDMTESLEERLSAIKLQHGRFLDMSESATEVKFSALQAVAGSRSWIALECRPDEVTFLHSARISFSSHREELVRCNSMGESTQTHG